MKEYKDNLIGRDTISDLELKIRNEYKKSDGWLPDGIETYDLVQCGYPVPDHGEMILRTDGGTNENMELLPPTGKWCKVEDVANFINNIIKKLDKTDLENINYVLKENILPLIR